MYKLVALLAGVFLLAFYLLCYAIGITKYVDATPGVACTANYNPNTRACDANGSFDSFTTVETGIAALGASNTLLIRAGSYSGAANAAPPSGTVLAPTVIRNQPGEVFTWTKTSGSSDVMVSLSGKNYITFTCDAGAVNCNYDGANYDSPATNESGSFVSFGSSNIVIENSHIFNTLGNGVYGDQTSINWVVRGNHIHTTGGGNTAGFRGHNIYLESDGWLIEHNELHDAYGVGIHCYSGFAGNTCDSGVYRYNKIYNVGKSALTQLAAIVLDGHGNTVYRNTIRCGSIVGVENAFHQGIQVYSFTTGNNDNLIYHNSITRCGVAIDVEGGTKSLRTLVTNNAMFNNTNNIIGNANGTSTTNLTTDPGWTNADNNDFTIAAGSAAIDAGTVIAGFVSNGTPDIGAHETYGFSSATVNQNFLDVTLTMNLNTPSTAGGTGEWTALRNGVARTTVSVAMLSDSVARITFGSSACVGGETWTVTHTVGTAKDSAAIGSGSTASSQKLLAFTAQAVANGCGVAPPADPGTPWIYYKLDDNTGTTAVDQSVNVLNGTLTNGPQWITGFNNFGVHFTDQVDNTIAIPYGSGVNPFTQALTVCLAAKPDAGLAGSQRVVFASNNGTAQRFYIGWVRSTWGIGIQSSGFTDNPEFPVQEVWTRLCLVMNSGTATLYVNGVAGTSAQSVKTYTSYTLASNVKLGNDGTNTINYGGSSVDDFKLYKSALSAANILTDYQNWTPASPAPSGNFEQKTHQFNRLRKTGGGVIEPYGTVGGTVKVVVNGAFILDTQTDCTVGACSSISELLYANKNGSAFVPVTNFIVAGQNTYFYGPTSDSDILTGAVSCCLTGALTPTSGLTLFTATAIPTYSLPQNASIVIRHVLKLGSGAVDGDVICFKKYNQTGLAFNTYTPSTGACVNVITLQAGIGF